jgi:hypothetical protein
MLRATAGTTADGNVTPRRSGSGDWITGGSVTPSAARGDWITAGSAATPRTGGVDSIGGAETTSIGVACGGADCATLSERSEHAVVARTPAARTSMRTVDLP